MTGSLVPSKLLCLPVEDRVARRRWFLDRWPLWLTAEGETKGSRDEFGGALASEVHEGLYLLRASRCLSLTTW